MSALDLRTVATHVQATLTDPQATPTTGDAAPDAALVRLAHRSGAQRPMAESHQLDHGHRERDGGLGYWH